MMQTHPRVGAIAWTPRWDRPAATSGSAAAL